MRYGMAIDLNRCIGCHTCSVMCREENNIPRDNWWNRIHTQGGDKMDTPEGVFPNVKMSYMPVACQHCENPACVQVCPVGATYKDSETGVVNQDYNTCIGCRTCMSACPYDGVRNYNPDEPKYVLNFSIGDQAVPEHKKHVVEKCTLCNHRLATGLEPACIAPCPLRARYFGDFDDPDSEVSKLVASREYKQFLPEKGTNPSIYYLV